MEENCAVGIKAWSEDDRPREKLLQKGASVLSDAELISILIGSGTRNESAVGLARRVMQKADNDLNILARLTPTELSNSIKGIGYAKAVTIIAAMELSRRRRKVTQSEQDVIKESSDVYNIFLPDLGDLSYEEFWILLLNHANKVVAKVKIASGGVHQTIVDVKLLFKYALDRLATGIILCHNHPSGNLFPSAADKLLTNKIVDGAKFLDIRILDHVIIGRDEYFSFADEHLL
ncbi:MAG TPA: DNA repair protein RadC [Candidatus Enterocola sp.]|jgi:DNA repair protein RadC|nr:DNA repair protein RadC [Candidatus Enterocola sp.]